MNLHRAGHVLTSILLCSFPFLLSGCGSITGISAVGGSGSSSSDIATIIGNTHGGFNFIGGATVTLYATGNNYGIATAIANTTSSLTDGSFSFSQIPGALNDNGSSSFSCPTDTSSLLYLVARGGNTSGSGDVSAGGVSTTNPASALMTLIGPCTTRSYPHFTINEATTVAATITMAQFMNATTTDVLIGTPSSVAVGLQNSYATFNNLVDLTKGTFPTTFIPSSTYSSGAIMAHPESDKLITMANILASCVNTDASSPYTTTACGTLFANAKPPAVQTNNQPVTTVAATDTAMAAYYLSINPTQTPTRNTALYNLLSATSMPFGPGVGTKPNDWTIAIAYTPVSAASDQPFLCLNDSSLILQNPTGVAIDATGNVWASGYYANSGSSSFPYDPVALAQLSPTGGLMNCLGDEQGLPLVLGNGIAIDAASNVWYTTALTASSIIDGSEDQGGVYEYRGTGLPISWPVPNALPYDLVADKAGNIAWANLYGDSSLHVIPGAATAVTPFASTASAAPTDGQNFEFLALSYYGNSSGPYAIGTGDRNDPPSDINGYLPSTTNTSAPGGSPYTPTQSDPGNGAAIATDNNGLVFGGGACSACGKWFVGNPASDASQTPLINFSSNNTYLGGLNSTQGVAVDGLNHYWASLSLPSVDAQSGNAATEIDGIAEVSYLNGTWTAISPAPTNTAVEATCASSSDCPVGGAFQLEGANVHGGLVSTAIDPSGNVWAGIASNGDFVGGLVELLGAAAPVVTPLIKQPMGTLAIP